MKLVQINTRGWPSIAHPSKQARGRLSSRTVGAAGLNDPVSVENMYNISTGYNREQKEQWLYQWKTCDPKGGANLDPRDMI